MDKLTVQGGGALCPRGTRIAKQAMQGQGVAWAQVSAQGALGTGEGVLEGLASQERLAWWDEAHSTCWSTCVMGRGG